MIATEIGFELVPGDKEEIRKTVSELSEKRRELNIYEKEINFMNRFYVGVRMTEEERDDVYFRPTIESKLTLKNDAVATAKYE